MKAYALLGGPYQEWPKDLKNIFFRAQRNHDLIIGVDRGSLLLEELQITPDLAVGDFDSLKKAELSKLEKDVSDIRYSNPIKDLTDSELMVQIAFNDYHVSELFIFGATGGRLDHFLVNLFLGLNPKMKQYINKISLIDKQNKIQYFLPGNHVVKRQKDYPYFGVAALSACQKLNILTAKYELRDYSSELPHVFSSNEFQNNRDSFVLSFDQGLVAIIFSKDLDRYQKLL